MGLEKNIDVVIHVLYIVIWLYYLLTLYIVMWL